MFTRWSGSLKPFSGAESYTKPFGEKQGALCVADNLPTNHSPRQQWRGFLWFPQLEETDSSECHSAAFVLGPATMIGRNNSIAISAKITAIKFTPHPRMKSEERTGGARDSGVIELIK